MVCRDLDQANLCISDLSHRSLPEQQVVNVCVATATITLIHSPVFRHSLTPFSPTNFLPLFLYSSWAYESLHDSGIRLGEDCSPSPLVAVRDQGADPSTEPQFLEGAGELRRFFPLRGSGSRVRDIAGLHKPASSVCRVRVRSLQRVPTDQARNIHSTSTAPSRGDGGGFVIPCLPRVSGVANVTPTPSSCSDED